MGLAPETPLSILLVEDNPNDARLIRRHLEGAETALLPGDVSLSHVDNLDSAVEVAAGLSVDLVLLDLGLPESSGAETFDRAIERLPSVPIVVLTNLEDEDVAVSLLQGGAQDYLNKGELSRRTLVRTVRYALEREQRERILRETNEQLEVLNRILRHDIRNDVHVLQAWSESLIDDVPEQRRDDVRKLTRTAEHIREMTDNSHAFIEAVTGDDTLDTEPVRIDQLLVDECEKVASIYSAAQLFWPEDPPPVTVDANGMLASVFRNLLNNAVKHAGPAPTIELGCEVAEGTARVTVADDGPGVPAEQRDAVFGRGERGIESEGTGIGLYLVDTLVAAFGGSVRIEDSDLGGAAFVVELPIASI